jgi:hypothetical protein
MARHTQYLAKVLQYFIERIQNAIMFYGTKCGINVNPHNHWPSGGADYDDNNRCRLLQNFLKGRLLLGAGAFDVHTNCQPGNVPGAGFQ